MKLFRMMRFGIRDAFKSVHRNFSLSIASISCISITLLVVSLALLASFNVKNFSKNIKSDVAMVVFLKLGITDEDVAKFEEEIDKLDNVADGWKDSKMTSTDRKEKMMEEDEFWKSVGELIDNEDEMFHQSYEIKVKDIKLIKDTYKDISSLEDYVEVVRYSDTVVEQMVDFFDLVEKIAFVVVIILIIVTVFLIVNTIKLTIFSRKREISIMRVVGASNWTIKNPFIIEGFLIGIIGSVVPVIATIYGYTAFYNSLDDGHLSSSLIKFIEPQPFVYLICLVLVVIGVIVGMFGSSRAVRKYLKV